MKKDNAGLREKLQLREAAIEALGQDPVVLEMHAGEGVIRDRIYKDLKGVSLEKDERKCKALAKKMPTWPVYQCDSTSAVSGGLCPETEFSFVDIDPYGDPWPSIDAFIESERERPGKFAVAVNDGLRQNVKMGGAWSSNSLKDAVSEFGSDLYDVYLDVCRWKIEAATVENGLDLHSFRGYYGGYAKQMTHYYAIITC